MVKKKLPKDLLSNVAKYSGPREASILRSMGAKTKLGKGRKRPTAEYPGFAYVEYIGPGIKIEKHPVNLHNQIKGIGPRVGHFGHYQMERPPRLSLRKVPFGKRANKN